MIYDFKSVQYSTVQYSTVQYSTVQYSTVQHSTAPSETLPASVHISPSKRQLSGASSDGFNIMQHPAAMAGTTCGEKMKER